MGKLHAPKFKKVVNGQSCNVYTSGEIGYHPTFETAAYAAATH